MNYDYISDQSKYVILRLVIRNISAVYTMCSNIPSLKDKQFFNNNLKYMNDTSAQHTLLRRLCLGIVLFGVTVWHYSRLCGVMHCSPVLNRGRVVMLQAIALC